MRLPRILLVVIILCMSISSVAQSDFRTGTVVLNSGEELIGEIDQVGEVRFGTECWFRKEKGEDPVLYSPSDIKSFSVDDMHFATRIYDGKACFLKYLFQGDLNAFVRRDQSDGIRYYLEKEDMDLAELFQEEIEKFDQKTSTRVLYKTQKHKGVLKIFMQDEPSLHERIDSLEKLNDETLKEIVQAYQNLKGTEGQVFLAEKIPAISFAVEPGIGLARIPHPISDITNTLIYRQIEKGTYPQGGLLFHVEAPKFSEKFYLLTGILLSQVDSRNYLSSDLAAGPVQSEMKFQIPLMLGYIFPRQYKVRPSLGVALTTPSYRVGALVRLREKLNISAYSIFSFSRSEAAFFFPKKLKWANFLVGLHWRLS